MNYEDGMELASIVCYFLRFATILTVHYSQFHDAFLATQQDDRGKLRGKIMDLLSDAPTTSAIVHTTKEKRGFNDFLTASKLCPMKYLAEFKADSAEQAVVHLYWFLDHLKCSGSLRRCSLVSEKY